MRLPEKRSLVSCAKFVWVGAADSHAESEADGDAPTWKGIGLNRGGSLRVGSHPAAAEVVSNKAVVMSCGQTARHPNAGATCESVTSHCADPGRGGSPIAVTAEVHAPSYIAHSIWKHFRIVLSPLSGI